MININGKEWRKITFEDIKSHLKDSTDDETFFFEFKSEKESTSGVAKEICAFANTYGGYLFIGVEDDKTISGASSWNEERINNVIYNNISPTPAFDIKTFMTDDGKKLFVIRVEEGVDPPYITNKGVIYQRVSSSSCPVKDAFVLNHLYNKRSDRMARIKEIIEISPIEPTLLPNNLFATLDVGFVFISKDKEKMIDKHFSVKLADLMNVMKKTVPDCSISRVGFSYVISLGEFSNNGKSYNPPADLSYFCEIMNDGSVRFRIVFLSNPSNGMVDIKYIWFIIDWFANIYYEVFNDELSAQFINVYKYSHLNVYKQFTPVFDLDEEIIRGYLDRHQEKYGKLRIITSNRLPKTGYWLLDKASFDEEEKIEFNSLNLSKYLFSTSLTILGYIDPIITDKESEN